MKPKLTRVDFLTKVLVGDIGLDYMESVFDAYPYVYGAYCLLKPFNLDPTDILHATVDEENQAITLRFADETLAKKIKKDVGTSYTVCGPTEYCASCSTKGRFLTFQFV